MFRKGFSVIELLIVLSVAIILVVIASHNLLDKDAETNVERNILTCPYCEGEIEIVE